VTEQSFGGPIAAARPPTRALAKATIINTFTREPHSVMYNPEEMKLEQGNTFAEVGIPGLGTPPVQYVRGKARTLSMELFFDTYETGQDVRTFTAPVVQLLDKDPQEQAPPVLLFSLGRLQFQCVLVDAGQRYTMFLPDGTPVRSTLSVRFQEYVRLEVDIRQGLFFGSPTVSAAVNAAGAVIGVATTLHVTSVTDTLAGLAAAYLGDPALWREIARANAIDDPLDVQPGRTLVIPPRGGAAGGKAGGRAS
jgi:nucleoid-associated protein YgaU